MDAKSLILDLREKRKDDICFIIGGGPSKLKYLPDDSVLANKSVIATNNAYKLFPNALITQFADEKWYQWHKDTLHEVYKGPITTSTKSPKTYANYSKVIVFHKESSRYVGIMESMNVLGGNNAGHQAINLAYHIGFKEIVLIGFDMNPKDRQTHWHNEHRQTTNRDMYELTMIPGLENVAKQQEQLGFKVYNVNKESNLKCFPFREIGDFL